MENRKSYKEARVKGESNLPARGHFWMARFVQWRTPIFKREKEATGKSPAPSWPDFNSRMRGSEIAEYRYWQNISAALRPMANFILRTRNGSESASTCITDTPPSTPLFIVTRFFRA